MKLMKDYQTYIENVRTIRNISKIVVEDNDTKEGLIEKIKSNAKKAYEIKNWNDNFLNEFLFNKDVKDLSENDVDEMIEFVEEVFDYSDSLDPGISFKLYEKLLDYAKYHKNFKMYIKELYNTGISLFYLDSKENNNGESIFLKRMSEYFSKGASYLDRFEEFDSETRAYIIRCLGNKKVGINRRTRQDVYRYYEVFDEIMSIMTSKKYRDIDPSLPWDNYIYGMYMDQFSIFEYLKNNKDEYIANRVLEAARYVYNKDVNESITKYPNWNVSYYYVAAKYFAEQATLNDVVDELKRIVDSAKFDDTSINGINENLSAKAYLMYYASLLNQEEGLSIDLEKYIKDAYKYLDRLPGEYYRRTVSEGIRELVNMQSDISDADKTNMMNYLVAFHKPTYVHSLMVAKLAEALAACLLMYNPEKLIGVLGTKTLEEVLSKKEEIIELAYNCGIYHDVGKNMCMSYININERKLIDEEFECVKTHTTQGYELLSKNKDNELYALGALYHHRYYDGSAGYPEVEPCPLYIKPIVDILSVADSIDAATDSIGRHYKNHKTLDDLINEFNAQSGTRYAPYVVDLFKDNTVKAYINNIITNERILVYLNVYHKGKSYTISSYSKL